VDDGDMPLWNGGIGIGTSLEFLGPKKATGKP
jgi:hypothetical protein